MNKRFSIFLTLAVLFCVWQLGSSTVSANSADFDYFETNDGIAILQYLGKDTNVKIPDTIDGKPVTAIYPFAFQKRGLTSVDIPDTVTDIRQGAFVDNKLTSINIPSGVTVIESYAFKNNQLKEITIPSTVKKIKEFAFENNKLTKVTFQEGIQEIASAAFADNKLTAVTFPASLQTLGANAFGSNYILNFSFKGAIKLQPESVGLMESVQGVLTGWYTDKAFKNKWNQKITGPITIYANWRPNAIAKKLKIDNLSDDRVKLTALEKGYTYTLYKDAALKQKLASFIAVDVKKTVKIKQIGKSAGQVYVTVTDTGFTSTPEKISYNAARTPNLSKNNVTVKYAENKSTIQLKNLKVGTTYTIYRNPSQKVKIASFKATKTTRTITTDKLLKKSAQLYITNQQQNLRISTVTTACYPKTHLCPKELPPNGATIVETHKEYVTYKYSKKLAGGGRVTEVKVFNINNAIKLHIHGFDSKGKSYLMSFSTNKRTLHGYNYIYSYAFYKPVITTEAVEQLAEIDLQFKEIFQ